MKDNRVSNIYTLYNFQVRELLPDFSASSDEQDLLEEPALFAALSTSCIDSESLTEILHLLANEGCIRGYDSHMALAWMMDTASSCGLVDDLVDSKIFGIFFILDLMRIA